MPIEINSNQFYRVDNSLFGANVNGVYSANFINAFEQVSGTISDPNGVIAGGTEALSTFTPDGGDPTDLTFIGAGTIGLVSFFGTTFFPRDVLVFEADGETFLFTPDGLPPLSFFQVSLMSTVIVVSYWTQDPTVPWMV